jgi:GT2 family glycosyltransferase
VRSKRELSIIIVNYRSWDSLENCLQSLRPFAGNCEVLVVDNFSNDGNFERFVKNHPGVQFIASPANLGFGGGCRLGVSHSFGDFFLFLNPDVIANKNAIDAMLDFLKTQRIYGIVSCRQHNKLAKHRLRFPNCLRLFPIFKSLEARILIKRFRIQKLEAFEFIDPDWVSGSVLMLSRADYERIGGWSPKYWMYYEDPDLCKRYAKLGGKAALLTNSSIQHNHGGATRVDLETTALTKAEVTISRHVYIEEHFSGIAKMFSHCAMIFVFIFGGGMGALMGSIFPFVPKLKLHRMIWKRRLRYYAHAIKTCSWLSPNFPLIPR